MGLKDKLAGLLGKMPGLPRLGNFLGAGNLGPLEKGFVGILLGTFVLGIGLFGGAVFFMVRVAPHQNPFQVGQKINKALGTHHIDGDRAPAQESDEHGEGEHESEPGEGEHESEQNSESAEGDAHGKKKNEVSITGQTNIPKKIKDAQDGEQEEGYDLVDPDIKAETGLTTLFQQKEIDVSVSFRVGEIEEVVSGTKVGVATGEAMVYADVALEVDSYELQQEIKARATELRSIISASMGTFEAPQLRTVEGKLELKVLILSEMNRVLKTGKVIDVYFNQILVR